MKASPLVEVVKDAIEDIKGLDIRVMDVQSLTTITDYMVVCTGTSNRHVKSIADNVVAKAKEHGVRPLGVEGLDAGEWVLVDLGDVVAHVMQAQTRAFYQLEKLWDVPEAPAEPKPKTRKAKPKVAGGTRAGKDKGKSKVKDRRGGKASSRKKRR